MDKFTKVRNIGKGNMGACALARNNEDGKYYVIKQVDLTRMNKKERQQSLNEARVLSSLRHPNIINYVDSFLAKKSDHLCIVMEFADGGDLSSRIKKNYGVNFRETQVLDWFIQLVLSLHYVHQRKILHRDVKTQNVFLTSDNVVKLGDFGIARTLSNTYDQAKTFVGTPYYLSPELILERPYDHRSDVWAVGVVLYELLTLKHPFNATDMKGLMQRILKVQYDPIPMMYSTEMRNVVPRLLMKDPAQRLRLDEVLELPIVTRRLAEWMKGEAVPAKYLESLLKLKLLPESALNTADANARRGSHVSSPLSVDSNRQQPLPQQQPDERVSIPKLSACDGGSGSQAHIYHQPQQLQPSGKLPSMRKSSEVVQSTSNSARAAGQPQPSHVSQSKVSNYPTQSRLSGNPSSALYKFYRSPGSQHRGQRMSTQRSQVPSSTRSNPVPARLSNLDNFYQQLNYYQQGGGVANGNNNNNGYPASSGAVGQPYTSAGVGSRMSGQHQQVPVTARHVGGARARSESGHAAAYLNPLFRPSGGGSGAGPSSAKAYDAGNPHMDIKAMLQRAAMERAQRRLGGAT